MLINLFLKAGWVAYPLALFSIAALAILLERIVTLSGLQKLEEAAYQKLTDNVETLSDSDIESAPITQIIKKISPLYKTEDENLQHAIDVAIAQQRVRLRRYLGTLATIGTTAPFIGLFGTVLGVLHSFEMMSKTQLSGEAMSAGISEALSATAVGLLVAIPAIMAYNFLLGRITVQMLTIQSHLSFISPHLRGKGKGEKGKYPISNNQHLTPNTQHLTPNA